MTVCTRLDSGTYFDLGIVGNRGLAVFSRHSDFENAKVVLGHWGGVTVPAIEVADEIGPQRIRCPFAVDYIAIGLNDEAELLVTLEQ